MFVGLAVLPLIIVYYFAVQYINRGIDSWFDVEIEEGLSNAIELVQAVIEIQKRQNLNATLDVARRLSAVDQRQLGSRTELTAPQLGCERDDAVRQQRADPRDELGQPIGEAATSADRNDADAVARETPGFVTLDDTEVGNYEILHYRIVDGTRPGQAHRRAARALPCYRATEPDGVERRTVAERLPGARDYARRAQADVYADADGRAAAVIPRRDLRRTRSCRGGSSHRSRTSLPAPAPSRRAISTRACRRRRVTRSAS